MGGLPSIVTPLLTSALAKKTSSSQWRPPQWAGPPMVAITVPAQSAPSQQVAGNGVFTLSTSVTAQTTYIFDAVLTLEHAQRLTKTQHPVQTGANLSSHAYLEPAELVMYVGMSDVMQSYSAGRDPAQPPYVQPWAGNSASKSVNAYQQLLALQASRQPLTITTRLRTYTNMLITSLPPVEDYRTVAGLRLRVAFSQIFTASISAAPVSARPQDTQAVGLGNAVTQTPSQATLNQYQVTPQQPQLTPLAPYTGPSPLQGGAGGFAPNPVQMVNVPGAGIFTSNSGQAAHQ